jgi:hypothetical protein
LRLTNFNLAKWRLEYVEFGNHSTVASCRSSDRCRRPIFNVSKGPLSSGHPRTHSSPKTHANSPVATGVCATHKKHSIGNDCRISNNLTSWNEWPMEKRTI